MPSFTITLTAAQAQRIQDAIATPQNPTPAVADVKAFFIDRLRSHVHAVERRNAMNAIVDTPLDPT